MTDFWDEWSGGSREPIPAGNYAVELVEVTAKTGFSGEPRTELTLRLCPDQPRAGKLLWLDWPTSGEHVAKFGWLARMAYEAFGFTQRPAGGTPEEALRSMAEALSSAVGKAVTASVSIREYTTRDGEHRRANNVKRLTAFQPAVAPPTGGYQGGQAQANVNNGLAGLQAYGQGPGPAAPNPAAQPSPYGGEGYAAAQAQQGQNGGRPW